MSGHQRRREGVEGGFGSLEPVLAAAARGRVVGCVWAGGKFGECDGADGRLRSRRIVSGGGFEGLGCGL